MKKPRAFRPELNERLEERRVPSGAGGVVSVGFIIGTGTGATGGILTGSQNGPGGTTTQNGQ